MRTLPLVLVAALALAGCAKEIDGKKAESFIKDTLSTQTGSKITSVSCPDGVAAKKGDTFDCDITAADGSTGKVPVEQKDAEGHVSIGATFLPISGLSDQIATDISRQVGEKITLDCPDLVKIEKGATFKCEGTNGTKTRPVNITQKDDQGNVKYELG